VRFELPRYLPWQERRVARVLDNIDFNLHAGETLGIVGESGSGKSTLAKTLLGLQRVHMGAIQFNGRELASLTEKQWQPLRRDIQLVFQNPSESLSPRQSVLKAVEAPLKALMPELSAAERSARALAMLQRVGLDASLAAKRPRELSGGQCQRVGIARALVVGPKLLICDEPTSALDVSVQAQIINLLRELQAELGLTLLFISHDLAVVSQLADRVLVLYAGRVMEQGDAGQIFSQPAHPYSQALLKAVPVLDLQAADSAPPQGTDRMPDVAAEPAAARSETKAKLAADAPSLTAPLLGCAFRSRCPIADDHCGRVTPALRRVRAGLDQFSACHFSAPELPSAADAAAKP
jgi:oligopeptide transport system ATP-binding protein